MVEASKPHNRITGALYATLRHHLRGGPCDVYTLDMKVCVDFAGADTFYYPDVVGIAKPRIVNLTLPTRCCLSLRRYQIAPEP
ncbi:MAG: Uma2 family endonuclease [Pseudomonadota bacterium]|nr:Uma2 family endonuclease [Pseudomonadota bacterium]